jgi:hypothetical protein
VRLEEIINTCTSTTRRYWRTQRNVAARRKRTQLFEGKLFKDRHTSFKKTDIFMRKDDKFNSVILAELREEIQMFLGNRFQGIEFEEKVLYAMASNCGMFGSGMFRYNEKQLFKKFLDEVDLPPLAHLDVSLKEDLKFHAKFLAMFVSKMKKDRVSSDQSYLGISLKEEKRMFEGKNDESIAKP